MFTIIQTEDERSMKARSFLNGKGWIFTGMILTTMLIGILGACDAGNGSNGCDPGPVVQDTRPLIPDASWDCGMPDGIPSPESGDLVFTAEMEIGDVYDVGQTPYGHRQLFVVKGGTVKGPAIDAQVLGGGLDYQLTLSNGAMEIDQVNIMQTSDGKNIYFRTCGASADANDVRIVPEFEALNSSDYSFLNTGKYAGTRELDAEGKKMTIKVYDVTNVTVDPAAAGAVRVTQPDDVPDQSWECREVDPAERKGDNLFTAKVELGPWVTVGQSTYGWRNSIPITSGPVTGGITGKVLFGGADHQVWSAQGINLDARYTLQTDEGDIIIVRNCGPMQRLAPILETSIDGNYDYLNYGKYLSSFPTPNMTIDAVTINFFESVIPANE